MPTPCTQAGRRDEAAALFREAEEMQAGNQPEYPLLYSVQGFQNCDLLLAAAERAAWRYILNLFSIPQPSSLPESCRAVSERATTALQIVLNGSRNLLDIALNRLTLGRAALYAAILEGLARDQLAPWRESLQRAVDGLPATLGCKSTSPLASSPAPGCIVSPARAPRAPKATSMRPSKSPNAGRCHYSLRTFICTARGCLD
jgi:hypothetical protein